MEATPPLTKELLSRYFNFPVSVASERLGLCITALKQSCRSFGIVRWPYRKLQALQVAESQAEASLSKSTTADSRRSRAEELAIIRAKRRFIESDPNAEVDLSQHKSVPEKLRPFLAEPSTVPTTPAPEGDEPDEECAAGTLVAMISEPERKREPQQQQGGGSRKRQCEDCMRLRVENRALLEERDSLRRLVEKLRQQKQPTEESGVANSLMEMVCAPAAMLPFDCAPSPDQTAEGESGHQC